MPTWVDSYRLLTLGTTRFGQNQTFSAIDNGDSKAAYLDRYKLLSHEERESLPADAFDPVRYVSD